MGASSRSEAFEQLCQIMTRLRAPDGCPWDREQSFASIKPYLLEESYEVMDAIDAGDFEGLAEELGDLMLQAVFLAQMAQEEGRFEISDSLKAINEKLIRRHPHVFAAGDAKTAEDVTKRWDEIKAQEKPRPKGLLAGVPSSVPALVEAQKISKKAADAGFDWENVGQVYEKLQEEVEELQSASPEQRAEEIGDLLFTAVNLARFYKVDPEQALRATNAKFRKRFGMVEAGLEARGRTLQESNVKEMEELWQLAKKS